MNQVIRALCKVSLSSPLFSASRILAISLYALLIYFVVICLNIRDGW